MFLPEALNRATLLEGMAHPDYADIGEILDVTAKHQDNIPDPRKLGEVGIALSEAMPKAGYSGIFLYTYGTLSVELANGMDTAGHYKGIVPFQHKDELAKQMGFFMRYALRPVRELYNQAVGLPEVSYGDQTFVTDSAAAYWQSRVYDQNHQLASASLARQFFSGGMFPHVVLDLGPSVGDSKVTRSYKYGGDFANVNPYIRITTGKLAPDLFPGDERLAARAVEPITLIIGALRSQALRTHEELDRAESDKAVRRIMARQRMLADALGLAVMGGDPVVKALGLIGGRKRAEAVMNAVLPPEAYIADEPQDRE